MHCIACNSAATYYYYAKFNGAVLKAESWPTVISSAANSIVTIFILRRSTRSKPLFPPYRPGGVDNADGISTPATMLAYDDDSDDSSTSSDTQPMKASMTSS